LRILHLPLDHTDAIGRYARGQFFADSGRCPVRGEERFRWYFVLHLFDDDGGHVDSHVWSGGADSLMPGGRDSPPQYLARRQFHFLVEGLPELHCGDITIRPFRLERQGIVFGLVDESARQGRETFVLDPGGLTFSAPWDGRYECHHDRQPEPFSPPG
jgi:hypothetical protein